MDSLNVRTDFLNESSLMEQQPPTLSNPDRDFEQTILLCPRSEPGKIYFLWNTDLHYFDTSKFIPANITNDYSHQEVLNVLT